jgi:hypothetical protein
MVLWCHCLPPWKAGAARCVTAERPPSTPDGEGAVRWLQAVYAFSLVAFTAVFLAILLLERFPLNCSTGAVAIVGTLSAMAGASLGVVVMAAVVAGARSGEGR